jgi:hypothetical protein
MIEFEPIKKKVEKDNTTFDIYKPSNASEMKNLCDNIKVISFFTYEGEVYAGERLNKTMLSKINITDKENFFANCVHFNVKQNQIIFDEGILNHDIVGILNKKVKGFVRAFMLRRVNRF